MSGSEDDELPLLQPSSQPSPQQFVRGSSSRISVRGQRSHLGSASKTLHPSAWTSHRRPPVPPHRPSSEDQPSPGTHEAPRKPQPCGGDRPVLRPKPPHLTLFRAQSCNSNVPPRELPAYTNNNYVFVEPKSPSPSLQEDFSRYANGSNFGMLQRTSRNYRSLPEGRKITPPADVHSTKSGPVKSTHWWSGIFRRSPSHSPSRAATRVAEKTNTKHEVVNDYKLTNPEETTFRSVMHRLQGRSKTPSPHRTPSTPSPVTYRRIRNPSDMPSRVSLKRYGSLPLKSSDRIAQPGVTHVSRAELNKSTVCTDPQVDTKGDKHKNSYFWAGMRRSQATDPAAPRPDSPSQSRDSRASAVPEASTRHDHRKRVEAPPPKTLPRKASSTENHKVEWPFGSNTNQPRSRSSVFFLPTPPDGPAGQHSRQRPRTIDQGSSGIDSAIKDLGLRKTVSASSGSSRNPVVPLLPIHRSDGGPSKIMTTGSTDGSSPPRRRRPASPNVSLNVSPTESKSSTESGYSSPGSGASSRVNSVISDSEEELLECFSNSLDLAEEASLAAKSYTDHFSYLLANEAEYIESLQTMLQQYQTMCQETPSRIRQHFDLAFKQMEAIYQFQVVLLEDLRGTGGRAGRLASVFTNNQFQCYSRYTVMTPGLQREFHQYSGHLQERFPDLKRNILKPALRINFYTMILDTFKKEASEWERREIQSAIDYLNQLKRKANTEMTLSTVINSPVDLRLGGDLLHIGELTCLGGGSLQKKKYQVILFENLLIITSSRIKYFKYKVHYRVEQVEGVEASGENELHLNVLSEGHMNIVTLKFRARNQVLRDEWVQELQKITKRNTKLRQMKDIVSQLQSSTQCPLPPSRMLPLSLFSVFPLLQTVVTDSDANQGQEESLIQDLLQEFIIQERAYVSRLSSLLDPESQKPPAALSFLLEKLHTLHSKKILPKVELSRTVKEFVDYFVRNIDLLSVYPEYIVLRSQLTVTLDRGSEAGPYISPVQHFAFYCAWLRQVCHCRSGKDAALRALTGLQEYVRQAQVQIMREAIVNGRVDFQRSGNLLLMNIMEVKTRKKEVRGGLYFALLFERVIILTKLKLPCYEYVMDIWLDQVNLGPPCGSESTFKLEVRQGAGREPVTYDFCGTTPSVKQLWVKKLHEQMLIQVKKIRQHTCDGLVRRAADHPALCGETSEKLQLS